MSEGELAEEAAPMSAFGLRNRYLSRLGAQVCTNRHNTYALTQLGIQLFPNSVSKRHTGNAFFSKKTRRIVLLLLHFIIKQVIISHKLCYFFPSLSLILSAPRPLLFPPVITFPQECSEMMSFIQLLLQHCSSVAPDKYALRKIIPTTCPRLQKILMLLLP